MIKIAKEVINGVQKLVYAYFRLLRELPTLLITLMLSYIQAFFFAFTYHLFTLPAKPFHKEVALIVGADSVLGRAFAVKLTRLNGTVICVDKDKERGETFVTSLNESNKAVRAYFFQCDVRSKQQLLEVVHKTTKEVGDISILLNCSSASIVSTYHDVYKAVLPVMKTNQSKSNVVCFIKTYEPETRAAISALYDSVRKELRATNVENVSTLIAHVYPKITLDNESRGIWGHVKPEQVAERVLDGIARGREVIFMPELMVYINFLLKFLPSSMVELLDGFFFDDVKK